MYIFFYTNHLSLAEQLYTPNPRPLLPLYSTCTQNTHAHNKEQTKKKQ